MLLDDLAAIDLAAVTNAAARIEVARFNALPRARAANLLRYAWTAAGFRAPDTAWLDEALKQLAGVRSASPGEIRVSTADGELRVYRGEVHLIASAAAPPKDVVAWNGESEIAWAGGRVVFSEARGAGIRRTALAGGKLVLRPRMGGERLRLDVKRPTRSLRNLLQEAALPPWKRELLPLLWRDDRLLWVGGVGVDCAYACPPGEAGIVPLWQEPLAEAR